MGVSLRYLFKESFGQSVEDQGLIGANSAHPDVSTNRSMIPMIPKLIVECFSQVIIVAD